MRMHFFADLNADGALDALVMVPRSTPDGRSEFTLVAVSLADGKQLWSRPLRFHDSMMFLGDPSCG